VLKVSLAFSIYLFRNESLNLLSDNLPRGESNAARALDRSYNTQRPLLV